MQVSVFETSWTFLGYQLDQITVTVTEVFHSFAQIIKNGTEVVR
jgi:phage-related protein